MPGTVSGVGQLVSGGGASRCTSDSCVVLVWVDGWSVGVMPPL
jgi:hypothetical protein